MAPPPLASDERGATTRRRRLRAAVPAHVAVFSRMVSLDESGALDRMSVVRGIARAELRRFDGWLFGTPGDGIFALFESAIDAVSCGLAMQARIAPAPEAGGLRIRIGVHMGDVLFEDDMLFGETLAIAARLEALAEPGGVIVSQSVRDAVASRLHDVFNPRGTPPFRSIDRRIEASSVAAEAPAPTPAWAAGSDAAALDRTGVVPIVPAPPPGGRPATAIELAALTRLLARHIGPIAPMVAERRLPPDAPAIAAMLALADVIPNEMDCEAFIADARRELGRS